MVEDVEVLENVFRLTVSLSVKLISSGFAIRNPGLGIRVRGTIFVPLERPHTWCPLSGLLTIVLVKEVYAISVA